MKTSLLIKNGIIITLGDKNQVLYDHAILIKNGIITQVAPTEKVKAPGAQTIDASGKVIMPGFINTHSHFYSTLVRGLGKAKPSKNFQEVLENLWWRLDKKLSLGDTYYSALLMLIAAIKKGTTTIIDHHASPGALSGSLQEIAKAVRETGLRASLCYELSDRDGKDVAQAGLDENEAFIKYCQSQNDDQLKAMFGLHASFTLSEQTLEKASEIGNRLNSGFHVHVAEAESDQTSTFGKTGMRVVERFLKHNILGPNTIAAHCIHITDKEMDILADTDTIVVHNPQSNMNNAVGIANIIKMSEKGILVGLGTDAMTINMLEEVRVALWAQHLLHNNPSVGFMEAVNTLFKNNRKIANRFWNINLGEIRENAAADIVLIDYESPTPLDENTVWGHLIFGISQASVDTTIANGEILMQNKKLLLDIDEKEINAKAREITKELWGRF